MSAGQQETNDAHVSRDNPFHEGERRAQQLAGVHERMATLGARVIRPFMPDQHREFFAGMSYLFAAARGADGYPWATVLTGPRGFAGSPTPTRLEVSAALHEGDPACQGFAVGAEVGLLGIELETRRRNRMNGVLRGISGERLALDVEASFGNCPQHIQVRPWVFEHLDAHAPVVCSDALEAGPRALLQSADTFFIASGIEHSNGGASGVGGLDVGHRGGAPGLLELQSDRRVSFIDFAGNNFFNTVGNLMVDPRVGLLVIDFVSGHMLQIAGRAEVHWLDAGTRRAERRVDVDIDTVIWRPQALR